MSGGVFPYANLLAIPIQLALLAIIAITATGKTKRLAVALSLLSFIPPFLPDVDLHLVRFIAAMGTVLAVARPLDLLLDRRPWSVAQRLWLLYAIFDSRDVQRTPPAFDGRLWLKALGFACLGGAGLAAASRMNGAASGAGDAAAWALRWTAGAVAAYASFDCMHALLRAGYRLGGVDVPAFHDDPIKATSLDDFWGRRWNMIIHQLLSRHVFRPLIRRGWGRFAVFAVFAISALMHFWLVAAALDLYSAATMALFFLIQGVGLLLERPLAVPRWRRSLQTLWVLFWVALPSPLLVEPLLQISGV